MSSAGNGASSGWSFSGIPGSGSNQGARFSSGRITGIRSCTSATSALGVVVISANVPGPASPDEGGFSQMPAKSSGAPSRRVKYQGNLRPPIVRHS